MKKFNPFLLKEARRRLAELGVEKGSAVTFYWDDRGERKSFSGRVISLNDWIYVESVNLGYLRLPISAITWEDFEVDG